MANKPKRVSAKSVIKKALKGVKKGKNGKKSVLGRVLMQGVGAVPTKSFGRGPARTNLRTAIRALDASSPHHLALPRATGPYTVVRTTLRHTTNSQLAMVCSFANEDSAAPGAAGAPCWSNIGLLEEAVIGQIAANLATNRATYPGLADLSTGATLVPAAITVQIMNATPVSEAQGIAYIGRSHSQLNLAGSTKTWEDLGKELTSFMAPRLCSGGKLALRGVKVSSYPMDMADLADFREASISTDGPFTWNSSQTVQPQGFAPIFLYNPFNMTLELLVTCEWRVRFGIGNPAASTHTFHPPTSDSMWASVCQASQSMGHGVVDITEDIAEMGAEAGTAAYAARWALAAAA